MSIEDQQQHVALPKLRGQPAYARPPRPIEPSPRPLDHDDLPLVAELTDEEREGLGLWPEPGVAGFPPGGAPSVS